jgi:hypothetical protein
MPNWGAIAGGLAGAGRGYEASQGRNIPGPQQGGQNGLLMKYLNRRKGMPQGAPAGLPDGSMPAPMPQQGAGPAPVIPQNPNAAMPGPSIAPPSMGKPVAPPQNQYDDPFGVPPQQNRFAQGQIVDKPTTALLGEDGPEAVIPLNGRPDAKVSTANIPQMNYRRGGR